MGHEAATAIDRRRGQWYRARMALRPTSLFYLLSQHCNERCSKCDHWQVTEHPSPPPVEQVIDLVRQIPSAKELCLVGGEPLVHRDRVLTILESLVDSPIRTTIVTNGTLCTHAFLDRVRDLNIHVVFSIDTLDPLFWSFVRGRSSFDRVMANFHHARQTLASPKLSVQSVLAEETVDHVHAVSKLCRRYGIFHSVQDYVQQGFNGQWTPLAKPATAPVTDVRCFAAGRNLSILPDGSVLTCFQQPLIPGCDAPLGRLGHDTKRLHRGRPAAHAAMRSPLQGAQVQQ